MAYVLAAIVFVVLAALIVGPALIEARETFEAVRTALGGV